MTDVKYARWRQLVVETLQAGTINIPHSLLKYYKRLHLNETETMLIIHLISYQQRDNKSFPTVYELAERMAVSGKDVAQLLQQLVTKQYIAIVEETDENGLRASHFDLSPLYEKLAACHIQEMGEDLDQAKEELESGMLSTFEQEFGRPLSPMECEMLVKWLDEDKLSDELILAALKEAVFAGKLNIKYIDRILFEWQRKNIKSVEQAKQHAQQFRKKGSIYQANEQRPRSGEFPFYNWLNS